jgi:NitT/TauT family transport system substrate-binding protein
MNGMNMTRRGFLIGTSIGPATAPAVRRAVAQTRAKIKVGYIKIIDLLPFFAAVDKGYFAAEGLDVEATPFAGGGAIGAAVASGDLQVGWLGATPLIRARDAGLDFKWIVGGCINEQWLYDTDCLMVQVASPVHVPKDMVGKKLATNALSSVNHVLMAAWLSQHGVAPDRVSFVEVPFPQMEAALKAGRVDVISLHEPFITMSVLRGGVHVVAHAWSEVTPRFVIASFAASDKWIKANRETVQAFIRAWNKGVDYTNANPGDVRSTFLPKWTGLTPEIAAKVINPLFDKKLLVADVRPMADLCHQHKYSKRRISPEEQVSEVAPVS